MDDMTHDLNKVTTLEEFMLWFADWCTTGDFLEVDEDEDTGAKRFYAYNGCQFRVAEFDTIKGLITYK